MNCKECKNLFLMDDYVIEYNTCLIRKRKQIVFEIEQCTHFVDKNAISEKERILDRLINLIDLLEKKLKQDENIRLPDFMDDENKPLDDDFFLRL
jgi:hypothetical protein